MKWESVDKNYIMSFAREKVAQRQQLYVIQPEDELSYLIWRDSYQCCGQIAGFFTFTPVNEVLYHIGRMPPESKLDTAFYRLDLASACLYDYLFPQGKIMQFENIVVGLWWIMSQKLPDGSVNATIKQLRKEMLDAMDDLEKLMAQENEGFAAEYEGAFLYEGGDDK